MSYKTNLQSYYDEMLKELKELIKIPSVYDEKTKTDKMPFGKVVDDALAYVAGMGERYGFKVDRCDGYCTELTIGEGERTIGIFAHADVVPATGKWDSDPFEPRIENGNYIIDQFQKQLVFLLFNKEPLNLGFNGPLIL